MEMIIAKGRSREKINVKRSVFIATASEAKTAVEAKEFIKEISKEFSDATHNCWAYRVFDGSRIVEHYSDAGEPSGSAGIPILNTIKSYDLVNVAVVVSRYFGGVKLGIRGLIDAYSLAAKIALDKLKKKKAVLKNVYSVNVDISAYGKVKSILSKRAVIIDEKFIGTVVDITYAAEDALVENSEFLKSDIVEM